MKQPKAVSVFRYSPEDRKFDSEFQLEDGVQVSPEIVKDRLEWLEIGHCSEGNCQQPCFESIHDLQNFNQKGLELTKRLEQELKGTDIKVEPFQPVYDEVKVSCGWWHLRDEKYGFPVSVQKLPVSDELKADFSLWRFRKDQGCLTDEETRKDLEQQGQELQERLFEELHKEGEEEEQEDITKSLRLPEKEKMLTIRRGSW
jgi:hypothetical protein